MKDYKTPVFISKEINPDEQAVENDPLQKRREMITNGIEASEIRIRNLNF